MMRCSNVVPIDIKEKEAQEACLDLARNLAIRDFNIYLEKLRSDPNAKKPVNKYKYATQEYFAYQAKLIWMGVNRELRG